MNQDSKAVAVCVFLFMSLIIVGVIVIKFSNQALCQGV